MELPPLNLPLPISWIKDCRGLRLLLAFCTLGLSGCIIAPIPHQRLHEYGVKGRIIDAATQAPVASARIETFEEKPRVVTSNADGLFIMKPVYGWHGAYMVAAMSISVFPDLDTPALTRLVAVTAPGYPSVTIPIHRQPTDAAYIQVGDIALKR